MLRESFLWSRRIHGNVTMQVLDEVKATQGDVQNERLIRNDLRAAGPSTSDCCGIWVGMSQLERHLETGGHIASMPFDELRPGSDPRVPLVSCGQLYVHNVSLSFSLEVYRQTHLEH